MLRKVLAGIVLGLMCAGPVQPRDSVSYSFALSGGMGITIINATDVIDYINSISAFTGRLDDFGSAAEFFGNVQLRLIESWGAKLEYVYLLNSYNVVGGSGTYEYFYAVHMPTLIGQYLDLHEGYAFKVGGGVGYHVAVFRERAPGAAARDFRSTGIGLKFDAEGNTALGERVYAYLSGDVRVNLMSRFKDPQGNILKTSTVPSRNVKMNFFAFGLKFGMIYYF